MAVRYKTMKMAEDAYNHFLPGVLSIVIRF